MAMRIRGEGILSTLNGLKHVILTSQMPLIKILKSSTATIYETINILYRPTKEEYVSDNEAMMRKFLKSVKESRIKGESMA